MTITDIVFAQRNNRGCEDCIYELSRVENYPCNNCIYNISDKEIAIFIDEAKEQEKDLPYHNYFRELPE